MSNKQENKPQKLTLKEQVLVHLEEKYSEPFSYVGPAGDSFGKDYKEMRVSCESMPGKEIYVIAENLDTDNIVIRDNYLSYKYEDETRSFFQKAFNDEFGECVVIYNVKKHAQSADLDANASFDEYLKDDGDFRIVYIAIPQSGFESREQVEMLLKQLGTYCGKAKIYANVIEDEQLVNITLDKFREITSFHKFSEHVEAELGANAFVLWNLGE